MRKARTASHAGFLVGAQFALIDSERRSKSFCLKHNLVDPRFTPVGLCSSSCRSGSAFLDVRLDDLQIDREANGVQSIVGVELSLGAIQKHLDLALGQ